MNKEQFLNTLSNQLRSRIPDDERQRIIEYYAEMIDDCMEQGVSENDAVMAFGEADEIVRDILGAAEPRKEKEIPTALVPVASDNGELHSIFIKDLSANIDIRPCEASDGSCTIDFYPSECKEDYSITRENGVLNIRRVKPVMKRSGTGKLFGFFNISFNQECRIAVNLPASELRSLSIEGISGDVDLNDVKNCAEISVHTVSGGIRIEEAHCALLSMQTVSGDVNADRVICSGTITAISSSADIELSDVQCGESVCSSASGDIRLNAVLCSGEGKIASKSGDLDLGDSKFGGSIACATASGDLSVHESEFAAHLHTKSGSGDLELNELTVSGDLHFETSSGDVDCSSVTAANAYGHAVSGDIDLNCVEIEGRIEAGTTSGDMELGDVRVKSGSAEFSSTSGDISGCLAGGHYSFRTYSHGGEVDVPQGNGPVVVTVRSSSGDINISML